MKKCFALLTFTVLAVCSCKNEANEPLAAPTIEEETPKIEFQRVCYQGIIKQDTINLTLQIEENQDVKGELAYLFSEKDKSNGTIVGKMSGDTLRANYNFISEGKESIREIVFLRKGKIMIEAYGEIEEREGKTVFKLPKKLFFDSATVLSEIDCLENETK